MENYLISVDGEAFKGNPAYHSDCRVVSRKEWEPARKERLRTKLRKHIQPGSTCYTVLVKLAPNGMSRHIKLIVPGDGFVLNITQDAAELVGYHISDKTGGAVIGGCGMDMGFAFVYSLGRELFPEGFGIKSEGGIRPRSKEHAAELVQEGRSRFFGRNGNTSGWDNDGGYALTHRWL